jgi:hypothetical protein
MRGWTGGGGLEPGVRGVEVKRKIEKSKQIKKIKIKRGGGEGIRRLVSPSLPPTKDWYLYPLFENKICY